jgi:hypothetical protein
MTRLYHGLHPALFAVIFVAAVGCDGGGRGTGRAPDTRTPAQYFKDQQANTRTPHGKIMMDSVEEKEGKIQYKTEDGKQWRVGYTKRADGTRHYGTPDEVK